MEQLKQEINFDHILLPVDGSEHSARAVAAAIRFAEQFASRISVISVYRHFSYTNRRYNQVRFGPIDASSPVELSLKAIAQEAVGEVMRQLEQEKIKNIDGVVKRGSPAGTILSYAEEQQVDAIVMGCRGLGELEGMLMGSVSHKVNSLAKCTCITVR